jgi:hypothetical protein
MSLLFLAKYFLFWVSNLPVLRLKIDKERKVHFFRSFAGIKKADCKMTRYQLSHADSLVQEKSLI